ncbi:MAG: adenosylcobinamide-GDP ribazoletransferase [Salaquimonas sp.]|jgi:adenosylcobinamide-GDP ribazoletransferase|nr:adenosylcobinamide-GDP ribazoletransferase [Salaquimonas sp.]
MDKVQRMTGRFLAALQFFVALPMPAALVRRADHDAGLNRAVPYFPLVGLVIGICVAFLWVVAASLTPAMVAAGLAIAAGVILTGGLHEDGLADCADGLGAREREKVLEIMRDSRTGSYGAAAIVFSIGLRWAALATLLTGAGVLALVIAHAVSRAAIAIALRFSTYARREGTGSLVADGISTEQGLVAAGIALSIAILLGGVAGILAWLAGFAAAAIVLIIMERRIGGYTGDVLGAMQQLAEIAAMVTLAALWSS